MKSRSLMGGTLVVLGILHVIGLFLHDTTYWFTLDYAVIAICSVFGVVMLTEKK